MIPDRIEKVKAWCERNRSDLFTAVVIFLVGLGSFGLGRLSAFWPEKRPLEIIGVPERSADFAAPSGQDKARQGRDRIGERPQAAAAVGAQAQGQYVGSKSGSAYHFPWCPGARAIKEANKVWFASKEDAEKRGYKPAANCSGL